MKLRVFIGSSSERKNVVIALTKLLEPFYDVSPWYRDVFETGSYTLPDLQAEVERAHLAILVYAPDDEVIIREKKYSQARDNVLFELGLFMSRLGTRACFMLVPSPPEDPDKNQPDLRIPSDLFGLTTLRYSESLFKKSPKRALADAVGELQKTHDSLNTDKGSRTAIAGDWELTWIVESSKFKLVNQHKLSLIQVGDRVLGEYEAHQNDGLSIPVKFDGTLQGRNLTGRWSAHGYEGAFQLQIDLDWNGMTGKWIGPSSDSGIKAGLYRWKRAIPQNVET